MMQKYRLEFILHVRHHGIEVIKSSLSEFGRCLEITDSSLPHHSGAKDLKIHIDTDEPTQIFDVCSQFGRIKAVKINEIK
jgi:dihydroxyacetone kinase-like predicted kinase